MTGSKSGSSAMVRAVVVRSAVLARGFSGQFVQPLH